MLPLGSYPYPNPNPNPKPNPNQDLESVLAFFGKRAGYSGSREVVLQARYLVITPVARARSCSRSARALG